MTISKLPITDIERKIEHLIDRIATLNDIIKEIKTQSAKVTLQKHLDQYLNELDSCKKELADRMNSNATNPD